MEITPIPRDEQKYELIISHKELEEFGIALNQMLNTTFYTESQRNRALRLRDQIQSAMS
jgi:hypothetical protein